MASSPQLQRLLDENRRLRERVAFFERNTTTLFGARGEDAVSRAAAGTRQSRVASIDVDVPSGARVEVKTSAINTLYPDRPTSPTKRWAWMRILGTSGRKPFTHLVLLGLVDARHRRKYADPRSPYVIFLLPRREVGNFLIKSGTGPGIQLTTNPDTVGAKGRRLFEEFQVTERELRRRLKIRVLPRTSRRR